jgi:hypothetical protein
MVGLRIKQVLPKSMLPNNPVALRLAMSALARMISHDTAAAKRAGLDFPHELDTAIEAFNAIMEALPLTEMERGIYCGGADTGDLLRTLDRGNT